jgi:hypothetical protein
MEETVEIRVFELVGSPLCVASDDGEKVFHQIIDILNNKGHTVEVSFINVESLTSAFLNSAIGQLYGKFPEDKIRESLKVSDMSQEDLALLKRVVDTAKEYFRDPERVKEARRKVLEEDDER